MNNNNNLEPILDIEVQLTDNQTEPLYIYEGDDIEKRVDFFINDHKLPKEIKNILIKEIMNKLEASISQMEKESQKNSFQLFEKNEEEQNENEEEEEENNNNKNYEEEEENSLDSNNLQKHWENYNNPSFAKKIFNNKNENTKKQKKNIPYNEYIKKKYYNNYKKPTLENAKGGEKLYLQFKDQLPKKEKNLKRLIQEKIEEENKNLTFTPEINNYSRILAGNLTEPIENRLLSLGNKQKENKLYLQTQKDYLINKKNTFNPIVKNHSKIISKNIRKNRYNTFSNTLNQIDYLNKSYDNINNNNNRKTFFNSNRKSFIFNRNIERPKFNPENNIHDYLYLESKVIKFKKNQEIENNLKQTCPFRPKLSKTAEKLKNKNYENKDDFIKRLLNSKNNKNYENLLNKKNNNYKPLISRKSNNNNKINKKITINLSGFYDKKFLKKYNENKQNQIILKTNQKKIFLEHSVELILKIKYEKYKEIFNLLDSDNDGLISCEKIQLSQINSEILLCLTPLFEELQKSKNNMTFKEFCVQADKFLTPTIFGENNEI